MAANASDAASSGLVKIADAMVAQGIVRNQSAPPISTGIG
jgi:hypothetical protein